MSKLVVHISLWHVTNCQVRELFVCEVGWSFSATTQCLSKSTHTHNVLTCSNNLFDSAAVVQFYRGDLNRTLFWQFWDIEVLAEVHIRSHGVLNSRNCVPYNLYSKKNSWLRYI